MGPLYIEQDEGASPLRWYENALITVPDTRTSTMSPSTPANRHLSRTLLAMPDFR